MKFYFGFIAAHRTDAFIVFRLVGIGLLRNRRWPRITILIDSVLGIVIMFARTSQLHNFPYDDGNVFSYLTTVLIGIAMIVFPLQLIRREGHL